MFQRFKQQVSSITGGKNSFNNELVTAAYASVLATQDFSKVATPIEMLNFLLGFSEATKKSQEEHIKKRKKEVSANTPLLSTQQATQKKIEKEIAEIEEQQQITTASINKQITLLKETKKLLEDNTRLAAELKDLNEQNLELTDDNKGSKLLNQRLRLEISELNKQLSQNSAQIKSLNERLSNATAGNPEKLSTAQLTVSVETLQEHVNTLLLEQKSQQEALTEALRNVSILETRLKEQEPAIANAKEATAQNISLNNRVVELNKTIVALNKTIETHELNIEILNKLIIELRTQEAELQKALETHKSCPSQMTDHKREIGILKGFMDQQKNEVALLRRKHEEQTKTIEEYEAKERNRNINAEIQLRKDNQALLTDNLELSEMVDKNRKEPGPTIASFVGGSGMVFAGVCLALLAIPVLGWILTAIGGMVMLYGAYRVYQTCSAPSMVAQYQEKRADLSLNGTYLTIGQQVVISSSMHTPNETKNSNTFAQEDEPTATPSAVLNTQNILVKHRAF